jgi:DNA-binding Lrp family transcriptional regulator
MVTAIVLLHVERDQINPVAEQLADVPGVTEVYSVAGRYDLAAVIRTTTNDQLAEVITQRIRQVRGILDTETLIAFRTYSRHDLDAAFSLGAR